MIFFALALATSAFEDLDALDRDVGMAAKAMGSVAIPLDRRLKMPRCPEAVQIEGASAGSLAVRCPALGWRLRVGVVTYSVSQPATAVRKGDPITIRSDGPGFTVETVGTALDDGNIGSTVRAKLDGGNRSVSGVVSAAQQISVGALNLSGLPTLSFATGGVTSVQEQTR